MFDPFFEIISNLLNFFYELVPNYAFAIGMLTIVVMVVTTPLTLKGTRSMIEMQRHQPEIRKLQVQFKDDRQKLNEEMMRFYKEHNINPLGGCFPLLIQAPVFWVLYRVVEGLTIDTKWVAVQESLRGLVPHVTVTSGFSPKYLDHSTELYRTLLGSDHMNSFGVDLSRSLLDVLPNDGFVAALPYIVLVGVIAVLSWFQQRQIMGRNPGEITSQQRLMMRLGPAMYTFFTIYVPLAVGVYFLFSTLWRVGQQAYITRSLYGHEDAIGVQAQRAMAAAREERAKNGGGGGFLGGLLGGGSASGNGGGRGAASGGRAAGNKAKATAKNTGGKAPAKGATKSATKSGGSGAKAAPARASQNGSSGRSGGRAGGGSVPTSRPHPRSRKKKKRK